MNGLSADRAATPGIDTASLRGVANAVQLAPLYRLFPSLPYRRSTRFTGIFVLTAMACWGEPGARGAASPLPEVTAALPDDEPDPVLAPAPPPTPAPPQRRIAPLATLTRPAPAPGQLAPRVAPKLRSLSEWARTRKGDLGFALRDLANGRELLAEGAEQALNPASNQKLLTVYPGFRISWSNITSDPVIRLHAAEGDIVSRASTPRRSISPSAREA